MTIIKKVSPKRELSTHTLAQSKSFVKLSAQEYTNESLSNLVNHMTKPSLSQTVSLMEMARHVLDKENTRYDSDQLYDAIQNMDIIQYRDIRNAYSKAWESKDWSEYKQKIKQLIQEQ